MRLPASTLAGLLLCGLAAGAPGNNAVTLKLTLGDGQQVYKIGEPISLLLTFTANKPGLWLDISPTEPGFPLDTFIVSPNTGVFPWLEDEARGQRYVRDAWPGATLEAGKPETVTLPLNAVYRFDAPGHYSVQVVSKRVWRGLANPGPFGPLTSNVIAFDVETMSEKEEGERAAELEERIRQATDMRDTQEYAEDLNWLTGDPSARVKLALFLKPKEFYPFAVDVSRGLWVARNRALVVSELERALGDVTQPLGADSSLLRIAAALKARLASPFDPADPGKPLPKESFEEEYLKEIAASLPERRGEARITAAETVFLEFARRKKTMDPEFKAAREIILTRFAEVNEFSVEWLLNSYGGYFQDRRMTPALKGILETQHNPTMNSERTAALCQLMKVAPEDSRKELAAEVCGENPTLTQRLDEAPFPVLPETDDCLKIQQAAKEKESPNLGLQWAAAFAARFATAAIYDDLLGVYRGVGSHWDKQAPSLPQ